MKRWALLSLSVCTALQAFGQGPLVPSGPPSASMKTLLQVEPRMSIDSLPATLSAAGSYYLVTNLAGTSGITLGSDSISIDLNGFSLSGLPGSSGAGIDLGTYQNVAVMNGTVEDWDGDGIGSSPGQEAAVISGVTAQGNAGAGFNLGDAARVAGCISRNNGLQGIKVDQGGLVFDSSAIGCGSNGFELANGSMLDRSVSHDNSGGGVDLQDYCTVSGSSVSGNERNGIKSGTGCLVSGCNIVSNRSYGIHLYSQSKISDSTVNRNIFSGILTSGDVEVKDCTVSENGVDGVQTALGAATVINSKMNGNAGQGIKISGNGGQFLKNSCSLNASSGILVDGSMNRIEENNVSLNSSWGLLVLANKTNNLIVRNTFSGNGSLNYFVPTNNALGPVVTVGTGFTGGADEEHPWANFEY